MTRAPVVVTTSDRCDAPLEATARGAAAEIGVPFVARHHKLPLKKLLAERADAAVVFEAGAVSLVDAAGTLRYSPGLAHLRIKQLDAGVSEDMLLRVAELREGERVLDCTVGLAADAQVAARLVGPHGEVVGFEKSAALYLLVRHGLRTLPAHPRAGRIALRFGDAFDHLAALPDASYDVVLIDPMFARPLKSSAAFEALRRHADEAPLTRAQLAQARRVARRAVLVKGARYSDDFKKLGLTPAPMRRNATLVWAKL
jgi:hypothetical protein